MSVRAIVVSYKTGAVLAECLAALSQAAGLDEIIVVDNGNAAPEAAASAPSETPSRAIKRRRLSAKWGAKSNEAACMLADVKARRFMY